MATTGDVWIIPSFRIWDYVLHVEHVSCVITNCGQHQAFSSLNSSLGFAGGKHYQKITIPIFIPPPNEVGGGYTGFTLSVRPFVCRRHGFRSISQVCFGISISNFICMLMMAIGRSLLIFSNVTFRMVAWRPYWIFWFHTALKIVDFDPNSAFLDWSPVWNHRWLQNDAQSLQ